VLKNTDSQVSKKETLIRRKILIQQKSIFQNQFLKMFSNLNIRIVRKLKYMFNDNPYIKVNREERHFGFLFGSALIHNREFADKIFEKYNSLLGSNLSSESFDIYFEVAALRDYWCDLGKSSEYSPETHTKRRTVLNTILEKRGYDPYLIDRKKVFWTNGNIGKGKLWCPSEWDIKEIKNIEKSENKPENDLVSLRWCFNAKPDILIVSNSSALFIEIKVESGGGKSNLGYDQLKIQEEISYWMNHLIPSYRTIRFYNSSLTLNDELQFKGLKWIDIIEILNSDLNGKTGSAYVHQCLSELKRYYT
jgi:hypothetical protein